MSVFNVSENTLMWNSVIPIYFSKNKEGNIRILSKKQLASLMAGGWMEVIVFVII